MIHSFAGKSPRIPASAYVAWNAEISGEVELGEGASIWFGAVLRGDLAPIKIGECSNVQDGAVLHAEAAAQGKSRGALSPTTRRRVKTAISVRTEARETRSSPGFPSPDAKTARDA